MMNRIIAGTMLTLLLVVMFVAALNTQIVKAELGTIYIRANGSIDPPDAPISTVDNVTYVLTGNITSDSHGIVVLRSNIIIDGAGYTLQCIGALSTGIDVESGSNVTIKNAKIKGFDSGISFFGNTPALKFSNVVGNYIANCSYGILGGGFSYNIAGNNIINNTWGVKLFASSNNTIVGNNITANDKGITLWGESSNNSVFGNNIESNFYGIMLVYGSSNNKIFHNNFINNTRQADSVGYNNPWDDGYPSGGNYWSNYAGVDVKSGLGQDLPGSDGIGDTPYIVNADNVDHYPLMNPYGAPPPQTHNLTITTTVGGTTDPAPGTYSYTVNSTVQVTAIPEANYLFDYWELDDANVGSANPIEVLMDSDHSIQAVFAQVTHQLTITSIEGGTTDPAPGTHTFVNGTVVLVTALPDVGYSFGYWRLEGEVRTVNPITILVAADGTLEAFFVDDIPPSIGSPVQDPLGDVEPRQNVSVTVGVTDLGTGVYNVTLWYSADNGATWLPLNMTETSPNTYQTTIPGYENCTWITYKIVAYDTAENQAVNDNNGYYYKYYVIPEFPSTILLPLFMLLSMLATVFTKKRFLRKLRT